MGTAEALSPFSTLGSVRSGNAVGEFEDGDHRDGHVVITGLKRDGFEQSPGVFSLALGGDGRRGIEH